MQEPQALLIKRLSLEAIEKLSAILTQCGPFEEDDFDKMRKAVGMSIIAVDENIINEIDRRFPQISDLD